MDIVINFNNLDKLAGNVEQGVVKALHKTGFDIERKATIDVAKDTGFTAGTIHTETHADGADVIAGGASIFLEFGTIYMAAQPFLGPAAMSVIGNIPGYVQEAIGL